MKVLHIVTLLHADDAHQLGKVTTIMYTEWTPGFTIIYICLIQCQIKLTIHWLHSGSATYANGLSFWPSWCDWYFWWLPLVKHEYGLKINVVVYLLVQISPWFMLTNDQCCCDQYNWSFVSIEGKLFSVLLLQYCCRKLLCFEQPYKQGPSVLVRPIKYSKNHVIMVALIS